MLLAAAQGMRAPTMAPMVRENEHTVSNWLKRYSAEGLAGLHEAPRQGAPKQVTPASVAPWRDVVRLRPRSLGLPSARWTLARLADAMAEPTGMRVEAETARVSLKEADMVLSRPQHNIPSPDPAYHGKKRRWKRPVRSFPMLMHAISRGCRLSKPWGVRKAST